MHVAQQQREGGEPRAHEDPRQRAQSQPQGSRPNHTPEKLLLPLLFSQFFPNHTYMRGRGTRRSPSQCLLGSCVVSQATLSVGA